MPPNINSNDIYPHLDRTLKVRKAFHHLLKCQAIASIPSSFLTESSSWSRCRHQCLSYSAPALQTDINSSVSRYASCLGIHVFWMARASLDPPQGRGTCRTMDMVQFEIVYHTNHWPERYSHNESRPGTTIERASGSPLDLLGESVAFLHAVRRFQSILDSRGKVAVRRHRHSCQNMTL